MRPRHWEQMSEVLGQPLAPGPGFTLAKAAEMGLLEHMAAITKVSDVAAKELSIEEVCDGGGGGRTCILS